MKEIEIGTDIIENSRLNSKVIEKFLSNKELQKYNLVIDDEAKKQYAAGRWAAKESIIKASNKTIKYSEIEIFNNDNGKPEVYINGVKNDNFKISISHEKNYSIAFCIFIK